MGVFSLKTVGIICEYDPFHLGHLRQIRLIREALGQDTAIVCAMSGNYVQRGMPAMWDKFTRASAAVACGADLVLELPVTKVLCSAEGFARGGVELLTQLGIIDHLSFGAEHADISTLMAIAKKLDESYDALKSSLSQGLSYAAAKQKAINDTQGILTLPNNILAVEYCRALRHFKSTITPLPIQRTGAYHAQEADIDAPSATAVRALFPDGDWRQFLPPPSAQQLQEADWYALPFGERAMLARLRALSDEEWSRCAHGSEGLWSKAMKAARRERSIEAIIEAVKSKRYPRTRIQRLLLCAYLGITAQDLLLPLPYARILAVSETGRKLVRQVKKNGGLPLINPGQTPEDTMYYRIETRSSDLYTLFSASDRISCQMEQTARIKI